METILIALFSTAITSFGFLAYNRPVLARQLILKACLATFLAFVVYMSYVSGQQVAYYQTEDAIADESDKFDINLDSISQAAYNSDPHLAKDDHVRGAMYFAILDIRHNQFKNVILAVDDRLQSSVTQAMNVLWVFIVSWVVCFLIRYASTIIENDRRKNLSEKKETETNQSTLSENK